MRIFLLLMLVALNTGLQAQITITSQDLPSANNYYRFSDGMITPAVDPLPTGAGFNWDFSFLQHISQGVDSFVTVSSTGTTYALVFADISFNTNRSNMAYKGGALPNIPAGGIAITDVFSFFYKSSSLFHQTGYGATVNGLGVPVTFSSKDRVFSLPLNFTDTDSSYSNFSVSIPNLGYYGHEQVRLSEVDGWGTLTTPYGTFDVLRVRQEISGHDTLFADTLGIGFGIDLPLTIEYKWLGDGQGIPLLQINTTTPPFGVETVTSIKYRDSLRVTGVIDVAEPVATMSVYPNPALSAIYLAIDMPVTEEGQVSLYTVTGQKKAVIWSGTLHTGSNKLVVDLTQWNLSPGFYFTELSSDSQNQRSRLVISEK
jgi:hypothetical protein